MRYTLGQPWAAARIKGGKGAPELQGIVEFYQTSRGVLVVADLSGLPKTDGFHGFHIHEGGVCKREDFPETGSHYDPLRLPHPAHAGDLPPLLSCGGRAFLSVLTDRFRVEDAVGRTVVIHSGPDDFRSQPAGNAGEKIGCGVIRQR